MRDGRRGIGDRWLAGELVPGVRFGLHDAVRVIAGERKGARGKVMLLARVGERVEYVVGVEGGGEVRVRQEELQGEA
ncbi:hypothetical protein tb265_08690 [Gemmatimonadetes bacterium T265]|nr:hypothetical protein tb265_08690 [Gemmatimonadetes bacterium T265]